MPYVLQYNKKGIEEKIIDISRYINLKSATFNNFMDWILELRSNLNIPHTLSEIIDDDKNLEKMSLMAFNDPSTSTNPIPVKEKDFLKMYVNAFKGDL
jgi:alcohol dehydrogenase class IV